MRTLRLLVLASCSAISIPFSVHAATLALSSGQGYAIGQTFPVQVVVSTSAGESINAVSATISYPANQLSLSSISTDNSIITAWASPPTFSNTLGTADIEGIIFNPGFTGQNGDVATLDFKVKAGGLATLSFDQASVLANDGQGTNVLTAAPSESVYLGSGTAANATTNDELTPGAPSAPDITSATNPDPAAWYDESDPSFAWAIPQDVTAVRLQYDASPIATPSIVYSPAISSKSLSNVPDGIYYFHAQFKNSNGWGGIAHFRFNIDTTPPDPFSIGVVYPSASQTDQRPRLYFSTTDEGSGIDHYEIKVGDSDFTTVPAASSSSPYILSDQSTGTTTVIVNAYDRAGNKTTASVDVTNPLVPPPMVDCSSDQVVQGKPLAISGTGLPDSTILVTLKNGVGATLTSDTGTVGDDGHFSVILGTKLDPDVYTVLAKQTTADGIESGLAQTCAVAVSLPLTTVLTTFILNYLSLILIVVLSASLVIAAFLYAFHKLFLLRRRMRLAVIEAEKSIHVDFQTLEKDLASHVALLESAQGRRQLTREEKTILKSFKARLGDTEKDIDIKLEQIKDETK